MLNVFINRTTRLITSNIVVGSNTFVPLLNGKKAVFDNLDNAASTPPFNSVTRKVNEFMEWYANVHRGMGFKSQLATKVYEDVRQIVASFVQADQDQNSIILVKNTTEAINKLANRLYFPPNSVIISTMMEHHSNDLPWRRKARVIYGAVNSMGVLDLEDIKQKLIQNEGNVKLLTVTGASNVTGYINDIHQLARLAHQYGALIHVDAAQLAPHRAINMYPNNHPEHIDFLAFSGHKLYAPYGTGVLIGPKKLFQQGEPEQVGGGTVELVTHGSVLWAEPPHKEEAGTPNLPGAVALAKALKILQEIGMDRIMEHEKQLTNLALEKLKQIPGVKIYGAIEPTEAEQRVGVISFSVEGIEPGLVASMLCYEGGIGVRHGCFCAHPYVIKLLGLSPERIQHIWTQLAAGNRRNLPGLVRISFGLYNTREDVLRLITTLEKIVQGGCQGEYYYNEQEHCFMPKGLRERFEHYFTL